MKIGQPKLLERKPSKKVVAPASHQNKFLREIDNRREEDWAVFVDLRRFRVISRFKILF